MVEHFLAQGPLGQSEYLGRSTLLLFLFAGLDVDVWGDGDLCRTMLLLKLPDIGADE